MTFNSIQYAVFLPVVLVLCWRLKHRQQNVLLLAASYVFYGAWDPRFLGLMVFSTATDYTAGKLLGRTAFTKNRQWIFLVSLAVNLGILATFKYFDFFMTSAAGPLEGLGIHAHMPTLEVRSSPCSLRTSSREVREPSRESHVFRSPFRRPAHRRRLRRLVDDAEGHRPQALYRPYGSQERKRCFAGVDQPHARAMARPRRRPQLRPRVVAIGVASRDFNDNADGPDRALASLVGSPGYQSRVANDWLTRTDRVASRLSALVRVRRSLREPSNVLRAVGRRSAPVRSRA